jgi:predicted transglutaminase-like cysteine proteinase
LAKRKQLIALGMPEPALRMAVVVTRRNEIHAVLTVATDRGDYVLDSLRDDIRSWDQAGYTWIQRQDPSRATGWVSMEPNRLLAVAGNSVATSVIH